jgi:hypothetical protein
MSTASGSVSVAEQRCRGEVVSELVPILQMLAVILICSWMFGEVLDYFGNR